MTINWFDQDRAIPALHRKPEPRPMPASGDSAEARRAFDDAEAIAAVVQSFWHAHGFPSALAWPHKIVNHRGITTWTVASNLRNGIPPGADFRAVIRAYRHRIGWPA